MAITEIRHAWREPGHDPSVLHVQFDRELTTQEAHEVAQAVQGVHERHEAARDFTANDPHHSRHVDAKTAKRWTTETPDKDADGKPVKLGGVAQVTRTFTGTCGDCGRAYVVGAKAPYHYVCPTLPSETDTRIKFRETASEGDAIDCGRDASGKPVKGV